MGPVGAEIASVFNQITIKITNEGNNVRNMFRKKCSEIETQLSDQTKKCEINTNTILYNHFPPKWHSLESVASDNVSVTLKAT
jgi:hypothetical protein